VVEISHHHIDLAQSHPQASHAESVPVPPPSPHYARSSS
jgi:hypothetical protein